MATAKEAETAVDDSIARMMKELDDVAKLIEKVHATKLHELSLRERQLDGIAIGRQEMMDKDNELTGGAKRANLNKMKDLDVQRAVLEKEIKSAIDELPLLPRDVYGRRKDIGVLR